MRADSYQPGVSHDGLIVGVRQKLVPIRSVRAVFICRADVVVDYSRDLVRQWSCARQGCLAGGNDFHSEST